MTDYNMSVIREETAEQASSYFPKTDIFDAKGRKVGLAVAYKEVTFVPAQEGSRIACYSIAPGFYYGVRIQKTKDCMRFGAYQGYRYFKTPEEREAYITKRKKGLKA